jgi:hypothetical protein
VSRIGENAFTEQIFSWRSTAAIDKLLQEYQEWFHQQVVPQFDGTVQRTL